MGLNRQAIFVWLGWMVLTFGSGCQRGGTAPDHSGPNHPAPDYSSLDYSGLDHSVPDLLEKQSKRLAGPNAIDCGRVPIRGNPKAATDCALAAQEAKKPFRVLYDLQGIDSGVAVAIVRTDIGTVGALMYDSDPMGGGSRAHEVVYPKRCPEPVHLWVNPSGRINCFQKESSPPRDAMSPNAEPY